MEDKLMKGNKGGKEWEYPLHPTSLPGEFGLDLDKDRRLDWEGADSDHDVGDQSRVFLKKRVLVIRWDRMIVAKKRTAKRIKSTKDSQQDPYRIETTCLHREDQK